MAGNFFLALAEPSLRSPAFKEPSMTIDLQHLPIEKRKIADLRPFRLQGDVIADLADEALSELTESIRATGQQMPIDILCDGTMIDGHQRVRALRRLKRRDVVCRIRTDLEHEPLLQEKAFVELNQVRRQMTLLDRARCYKQLKETEEKLIAAGMSDLPVGGNLRDYVAKKLGMGSGRNAERYLKVCELDPELQAAVNSGELKLDLAARLAGCDKAERAALIPLAAKGENCNRAAESILRSGKNVSCDVYVVHRTVERVAALLKGVEESDATFAPGHHQAISDMRPLVKEISNSLKRLAQRPAEPQDGWPVS